MDNPKLPKLVPILPNMRKRFGSGTMLVPSPRGSGGDYPQRAQGQHDHRLPDSRGFGRRAFGRRNLPTDNRNLRPHRGRGCRRRRTRRPNRDYALLARGERRWLAQSQVSRWSGSAGAEASRRRPSDSARRIDRQAAREPQTLSLSSGMNPAKPDFDKFAQSYDELLRDPIRDRFTAGGSQFFHARKCELIREYYRRRAIDTHRLAILDLGCGKGELLQLLRSDFAEAAGCDPSAEMLSSGQLAASGSSPDADGAAGRPFRRWALRSGHSGVRVSPRRARCSRPPDRRSAPRAETGRRFRGDRAQSLQSRHAADREPHAGGCRRGAAYAGRDARHISTLGVRSDGAAVLSLLSRTPLSEAPGRGAAAGVRSFGRAVRSVRAVQRDLREIAQGL